MILLLTLSANFSRLFRVVQRLLLRWLAAVAQCHRHTSAPDYSTGTSLHGQGVLKSLPQGDDDLSRKGNSL